MKINGHRQEGNDLVLSIAGYEGHTYRLETTADFAEPWVPQGDSKTGTGTPSAPQTLEFTAPQSGADRIFRIRVHPLPAAP